MKAECPTCGQVAGVTDLGELERHGTPECPHSRPREQRWAARLFDRDVHLVPGPDTWNPDPLEGAT